MVQHDTMRTGRTQFILTFPFTDAEIEVQTGEVMVTQVILCWASRGEFQEGVGKEFIGGGKNPSSLLSRNKRS